MSVNGNGDTLASTSNMSSLNNELDYDISELNDIILFTTNTSTITSTTQILAASTAGSSSLGVYNNGSTTMGSQVNADGATYNRDYYYNNLTNDYYYQNTSWNTNGAANNNNNNNVNEPNRNLSGSDSATRSSHHQMLQQHDQMQPSTGYHQQKPLQQIQQYSGSMYAQPAVAQSQADQQYAPIQYQQANYVQQQPGTHLNQQQQHVQSSLNMTAGYQSVASQGHSQMYSGQPNRQVTIQGDYSSSTKAVITHICSAYEAYMEPIINATIEYGALYSKCSQASNQFDFKALLSEMMSYYNLYATKFREFANAILGEAIISSLETFSI